MLGRMDTSPPKAPNRSFGTRQVDLEAVPAGWPSHRIRRTELASGTQLRIRPALPDDGVELQEGLKRLSERTRWLRFHAPVDHFSDAQLRHLVEVDHHDQEALVAEVREGASRWQPVAVARWYRDAARPDEAELAIVVEDAFQGRGVGRRLLDALVAVARDEAGIRVLTGEVLAENRGMLGMLEHVGVRTDVAPEGTVVHTRTWLVDPGDEAAPQ